MQASKRTDAPSILLTQQNSTALVPTNGTRAFPSTTSAFQTYQGAPLATLRVATLQQHGTGAVDGTRQNLPPTASARGGEQEPAAKRARATLDDDAPTISPTDVAAFHQMQLVQQRSKESDASRAALALLAGTAGTATTTTTTAATTTAGTTGVPPTEASSSALLVVSEEQDEEPIDPDQLRQILDTMFDEQAREKMKGVPSIRMPSQFKQTVKLHDHQVSGIRWLVHQETTTQSALPMYTQVTYRGGSQGWRCKITGRHQKTKPKPIRGGILADAMGLGKTIQTLGLILANPPPKEEPNAPTCTLIVCPVSVMANWSTQIQEHVKEGALRVALYTGSQKKRSRIVSKVQSNQLDVLIVSYETLRSDYAEHRGKHKKEKDGEDEKEAGAGADGVGTGAGGGAGAVGGGAGDGAGAEVAASGQKSDNASSQKKKRSHSSMSQTLYDAVFHRIVLDEAHMIRNSTTGVYHAAKKVKATTKLCLTGTPFMNSPEDIHSLLAFLGVESVSDGKVFRDKITNPIKAGRGIGLSRLRTAMSMVTLRRQKHTTDVELVAKEKRIVKIAFPEGSHKDVHDALFLTAKAVFDTVISANESEGSSLTFMQNGRMFEMLLRIRQACCSADLISSERRGLAMEVAREIDSLGGKLDLEKAQALLERLSQKDGANAGRSGAAASSSTMGTPPKVVALLKTIEEMKPDEKATIFSQFVSFLDIIQRELEAHGYACTRITGTMTATQRAAAMESFSKEDVDGSPRFILCQLRLGQGINLTRGNVCFMMDPWFQGSTSEQAQDRIHRISQTREVRVYTFVMKDTVEERMLTLQKRKAALGKGTMERLSAREQKLAKIMAMKDLFHVEEEEDDDSDDEFRV